MRSELPVLDGRYRLVHRLGEGAMGEVYRADHIALGRAVAVKLVAPALGRRADVRARFLREARTQASLAHPNIVATLDFGEDAAGQLYLVLELVDGPSLEHILDRAPPSLDEALELIAGVADGLAAAHARGIVHRDIKPGNILVVPGGPPKIADFGLATLRDEATRLTNEGSPIGTPAYLAPEQALGRRVDARADVYALGCTAYELLSGEPPFHGGTMEMIVQHLHAPVPALPDNRSEHEWDAIRTLVVSMMAKAPDERPRDGAEVARRVRAIQDARHRCRGHVALVATLGATTPGRERAIAALVEAAGGQMIGARDGALLATFAEADAAVRAASSIARLAGRLLRVGVDLGARTHDLAAHATLLAALSVTGETSVSARVHAALALGARGRYLERGRLPDGEQVYRSSSNGDARTLVGCVLVGDDVVFSCTAGHRNRIAHPRRASRYDAVCWSCSAPCRVEVSHASAPVDAEAVEIVEIVETVAAIALPSRDVTDDERVLFDLATWE